MSIDILFNNELTEYDFGPGHPFRGNRYEIFFKFLTKNLTENKDYHILHCEPAITADIQLICENAYISFVQGFYQAAHNGTNYRGDPYRFLGPDNHPAEKPGNIEIAARFVIGQAKTACDLVSEGKVNKIVSIGGGLHHAKPDFGEGFCVYNDVAFCARYLQKKYQLDRILILDTDAHAGNGTANYFYDDPQVLFIDLHQDPRTLYPGTGFSFQTGAGRGIGFTINVPMPLYSNREAYEMVFDEIIQPVTEEFQPQIIIRNGGSDPHFADKLTNLGLQSNDFFMIGKRTSQLAEVCGGKLIDLICSGYNMGILPNSWLASICGLADIGIHIEEPQPIPDWLEDNDTTGEIKAVISEVKGNLRSYWGSLRS